MRIVRGGGMQFIPAAHEDPANPGSFKKILVSRDDLLPGRLQMINACRLPAGEAFRAHYHEDMQEIFVINTGRARIVVGEEEDILETGDAVIIPARAVHQMSALPGEDVYYLAIGIAQGQNGRTILA